jgi:NAD(P)-dependent dehydrogenase (short-subunit alcohol dehydrogenase family)
MSTLAGKIAVISGGTTGIGLAIAQRFVAEGAHVFIFGRRRAQLDEAASLIGGNVTAIRADTPILDSQSATREDLVNMYQGMVPIGRLARAEEMASAALFLASEQSSYMTGADLMNDGGIGQV